MLTESYGKSGNYCSCTDKNSNVITIKYFDNEMPRLEEIEVGDWIDLLRVRDIIPGSSESSNVFWDNRNKVFKYPQGSFMLIYFGIGMILPDGFEAHILPSRSTFKNTGLIQTNSMGIVDNSYCGEKDEWMIPVFSLTRGYIEKYQRVAQFRIMPIMKRMVGSLNFVEGELNDNTRGGHGSTGKV